MAERLNNKEGAISGIVNILGFLPMMPISFIMEIFGMGSVRKAGGGAQKRMGGR